MLKKNYILLENGEIIPINRLSEKVPFVFIRILPIHLELCEFIASSILNYNPNTTEWKIAVNFLSQRSTKIRIITAIILLSAKYKIAEINVDFIGIEFLKFFQYPIKINSPKKYGSWIDAHEIYMSILKVFINKLFRLLRNRYLREAKSVIRSWIDIDAVLHNEYYNVSCIYIYPYYLNYFRGFKYIINTLRKHKNSTLIGVPYSFSKFLNIVFSSLSQRDKALISFEINAMMRHKKDFESYNLILTSDEYIPAIPILYEILLDEKKSIINNCHGIGFYNPYNLYTKMIVFNSAQKEYYQKKNNIKNIEIKEDVSSNYKKLNKYFKTILVYIDQGNLKRHGLLYEEMLQYKVMSKINNLAREHSFTCTIKFHPNRKTSEKKSILLKYKKFEEIRDFERTSSQKYIFINLYSTAFYDFRVFGDFYFIKQDLFDPTLYFGKSINCIKIEEIEKIIKSNLF